MSSWLRSPSHGACSHICVGNSAKRNPQHSDRSLTERQLDCEFHCRHLDSHCSWHVHHRQDHAFHLEGVPSLLCLYAWRSNQSPKEWTLRIRSTRKSALGRVRGSRGFVKET